MAGNNNNMRVSAPSRISVCGAGPERVRKLGGGKKISKGVAYT